MSVYPRGPVRSRATVSDDGLYRYLLERRWGPPNEMPLTCTFVMLNPSTADGTLDDPTIRRCVQFAHQEGCNALDVVNLFAYRATSPSTLRFADDPVGPINDEVLENAAIRAADEDEPIIAGWGSNAPPARVAEVLRLPGMGRLLALGVTKGGQPRHPLYLPGSSRATLWAQP